MIFAGMLLRRTSLIWLRLGNCSTLQVESLLRHKFESIKLFYADKSLSLLAL
jgi:predicted nuclease of predicted toxin-antitoxin system